MNAKEWRLTPALCPLLLVAVSATEPAVAQTAAWSGWARCAITTRGPGYEQTDTHTWIITDVTGNTTATSGPGSWQVVGKGNLSQGNPAQTAMRAEWAINGGSQANRGGQFALVPMTGGLVAIKPRHSQLRTSNGVVGYVQQTISNQARKPTPIAGTAWEWQFPAGVQGPATGRTITGSARNTHVIGWGYMQASGSTVTSSCEWSFAKQRTPTPPPAIPPTPVPEAPVVAATDSSGSGGQVSPSFLL
jgi:hypothetical protein